MEEIIKIMIGIVFLVFGFFLGNYLAKITKEELNKGQKWFKIIIILGFIGSLISLILANDMLFFSFLFIIIVSSRSLLNKNKIRNRKLKN